MAIFLMNLYRKGEFFSSRQKLIPTSCRALRVKLDRNVPENWTTLCEGNNLAVIIPFSHPSENKDDLNLIRKIMYNEFAEKVLFVAKNSPGDNLEKTDMVRFRFEGRKIIIHALTDGALLYKMTTIHNEKLLMDHFKETIRVREEIVKKD